MKNKVKLLLERFEDKSLFGARATAFNYLLDYEEGLFMDSFEGSRLLGLCIEILEESDDLESLLLERDKEIDTLREKLDQYEPGYSPRKFA